MPNVLCLEPNHLTKIKQNIQELNKPRKINTKGSREKKSTEGKNLLPVESWF